MLATVGRGGGPYNVGTGQDTTVTQLHDACAVVAGIDARARHEEARLGDVQRSVLDVTLIDRTLGWRAQVPLEDGLRRTWAWMKDHAAA
jgi:nucleoside-diphosphate-sugar epimerase